MENYTLDQICDVAHSLGIDLYKAAMSHQRKDKILPDEFYRNRFQADHNQNLEDLIEIGDTLIADYNNGIWCKDDICILIEKSPEYEKCTEGWFFNKTKNIQHGGNVQSFHYCN